MYRFYTALSSTTDPGTLRADCMPTWCQDRGDKKAKTRLRSLVQCRSINVKIWSMTLLQVKTCHVRPKEHPVNLDTISHSCIKFTSWMLSFIAMIVTVRVNFFFYSLRISYSTLSYSTVAQLLSGSSQITTQPNSSTFSKTNKKTTKNHGAQFVLANYSWEWSLPWTSQSTGENWLSFSQQLSFGNSFSTGSGT